MPSPTPPYPTRSYGGGAFVAQLTQEIGPSDLSMAITPDSGWVDLDGNPLGTTGKFTVVVDRFTDFVEKMECSAINLTTGVITITTRGFDGTTPQAHVPNGSPAGVQTCWSATEAYEANQTATYLLGHAGGTPTTGELLSWGASAPAWIPNTSGLTGNPAAHATATTPEVITGGNWNLVTGMASDYVAGGITFAGNVYTVPVTGVYQFNGVWRSDDNAAFTSLGTGIWKNGGFSEGHNPFSGNPFTNLGWSSGYSSQLHCTAGDTLGLAAYADPGNASTDGALLSFTHFSISLVSS